MCNSFRSIMLMRIYEAKKKNLPLSRVTSDSCLLLDLKYNDIHRDLMIQFYMFMRGRRGHTIHCVRRRTGLHGKLGRRYAIVIVFCCLWMYDVRNRHSNHSHTFSSWIKKLKLFQTRGLFKINKRPSGLDILFYNEQSDLRLLNGHVRLDETLILTFKHFAKFVLQYWSV